MKTLEEIKELVQANDVKAAVLAILERLDEAEETIAMAFVSPGGEVSDSE